MVDEEGEELRQSNTSNGDGGGSNGGLQVIFYSRQQGQTGLPPQPPSTNPLLLFEPPKLTKDGVPIVLPPPQNENWTALDFSHKGLHNLSRNLAYYRHLTFINLAHNSLTSLPLHLFTHLPLLNHLDVSFNHLASLPPQIGNLVNLETLLLYQNKLTELPLELGKCFRLKLLNVENNPILPAHIHQLSGPEVVAYLRERLPQPPPPPERRWMIFEKDFEKNASMSGDPFRIKVLCFNVLAESYATHERHSYCPTWAIDWNYRKKLVLVEIQKYSPDVLCLQEVEAKQYKDFFEPELAKLGYAGTFRPKSRAKTMDDWTNVDGCVILYKRNKFKVLEEVPIEYQSLTLARHNKLKGDHSGLERLMTKDNIAVALVLQLTQAPAITVPKPSKVRGARTASITKIPARILIANTHIHWDPSLRDVKLMQTQLLMEELMNISQRYKEPPIPMVVSGDFNSMPDSGVYELLAKGSVSGKHPDLGNYFYGQYSTEGLQHNIMLASAYGNIGEPSFTNYTGDYIGVLDYIWYTEDTLKASGLLSPVDYTTVSSPLPNPHFPSDHISLLAEFEIKHRS